MANICIINPKRTGSIWHKQMRYRAKIIGILEPQQDHNHSPSPRIMQFCPIEFYRTSSLNLLNDSMKGKQLTLDWTSCRVVADGCKVLKSSHCTSLKSLSVAAMSRCSDRRSLQTLFYKLVKSIFFLKGRI